MLWGMVRRLIYGGGEHMVCVCWVLIETSPELCGKQSGALENGGAELSLYIVGFDIYRYR